MSFLSENLKATLGMRAFGFLNIPLLFISSPRVVSLNSKECRVLIPLRKLVKNHLGSMYFGALAIGADTCVGMLAFEKIKQSGQKIQLVFKDFHADFVKRAEGDTVFVCQAGELIDELIAEITSTKGRAHRAVAAQAYVNGELVANFTLTLSLKLK